MMNKKLMMVVTMSIAANAFGSSSVAVVVVKPQSDAEKTVVGIPKGRMAAVVRYVTSESFRMGLAGGSAIATAIWYTRYIDASQKALTFGRGVVLVVAALPHVLSNGPKMRRLGGWVVTSTGGLAIFGLTGACLNKE